MKVYILSNPIVGNLEEEASPNASPQISLSLDNKQVNIIYLIHESGTGTQDAVQEATDTVRELVGEIEGQLTGVTAADFSIKFTQPHSYAPITGKVGQLGIVCDQATVQPWGQSGSSPGEWSEARIQAHYQGRPTDPLTWLIDESMDSTVDFRTIPNRKLYWDLANSLPLGRDESPGRQIQLMRWLYTIKGLPSLPTDIFSLQGKINSAAMTSPTYGQTFPIGTVLFKAPVIVPTVGMNGTRTFDVTWEFLARPEGSTEDTWNKGYRAGTVGLQTIYNSSGVFEQYTKTTIQDLLLVKA